MDNSEAVKKGVEAMKSSTDNKVKEEKSIKAEDIKLLIENLTIQFNKYNQEAENYRTMAIKTQGAIEVANAQLKGLQNDTESTD